ncbi:hypothetical protein [Leptospira alexanderi]|uniref:hypothetical protein n=1 Tax=Leptospira alexanderi TaxID=100053 RepID=UPI000990C675|nr:hypothetical protein [Leptospira alexanderi]
MLDYIHSHPFPSTELAVLRAMHLPENIFEFKIWRDDSLNIQCKFGYRIDSRHEANVITAKIYNLPKGKKIRVLAQSEKKSYFVLIKDIRIKSFNWNGDVLTVNGEIYDLLFRNVFCKEVDNYTYWYLNGSDELIYNQILLTHQEYSLYLNFGEGKEYKIRIPPQKDISLNHAYIKFYHGDVLILIGCTIPTTESQYRFTWIRYYSQKPPSEKISEAVASLYSFLSGCEILPLGNVSLNKDFIPIRSYHLSSCRAIIDNIVFANRFPPIPISYRRSGQLREKVDSLLPQLLANYLEKGEDMHLKLAIWYINQSLHLPLDIQLQPMSTAFDILKKAWFKSKNSISQGFNINEKEFQEILGEDFKIISERLEKNPKGKKIIGRILKANTKGDSEKTFTFLEELGLEIDLVEREVLEERNRAVHGTTKPRNYSKLAYRTMAYRTLLNRIILRILNYQGDYIDYSWDCGAQVKYTTWPLSIPMQGRKNDKKV